MRQCPVCKSETGNDPVCPVCGFDITCDYERFPTLGAGIPRDLKARALKRVADSKSGAEKAAEKAVEKAAKKPAGAPKPINTPPVILLSEKEIGKLTFRKGLYAFLFSIAALFFMALSLTFISVAFESDPASSSRPPDSVLIGFFVLAGFLVLFFALLKKTLKKMKPDEWAWKKQDGQWIVLPKEKDGTGKKKKMTTALMLFNFGWPLGLHVFYLDGFWGGVLHCAILYGGGALAELLTGSEGKLVIFGFDVLNSAGIIATLLLVFVVYFSPLIGIMGMAPEFEKGEF